MKEKTLNFVIGIIIFSIFLASACKKEEELNPVKFVQTIHFSDYNCIINYNEVKLPISIYYDHLNGSVELSTEFEYSNGKIVKLINYGLDEYAAWGSEKEIETEYYFDYPNGFLTSIYATSWHLWPFIVTLDNNIILIKDEERKATISFEKEGFQTIIKLREFELNEQIEYLETDNKINIFKNFPRELKYFYHVVFDFESRLTNDFNFGPFLEHNPSLMRIESFKNEYSSVEIIKYTNYEYHKSFMPKSYIKTTYNVSEGDTTEISSNEITIDYSEGFQ